MSSSVRVENRGRARRLICVGAAVLLASGGSVTALLALTSAAAGSLVTAAAHRPGTLDDWRRPAGHPQASRRDERAALLLSEHDARFGGQDVAGLRDRLAALGAEIVEANALFDRTPFDRRQAKLQTASLSGFSWRDAKLLDGEPAAPVVSAAPVEVAAAAPDVSPEAERAEERPPAGVVELASLDATVPLSAPLEDDAAPLAEEAAAAEPVRPVPVPRPRPIDVARMAQPDAAKPRPAALAYATPELETRSDSPNDFFRNLMGGSARLPGLKRGVAVYDIATATVRLPNGELLEAHSGLGHRQDNPAYVREKNRGPTPPNVYDLRMREALFHGAEAIRLTPRDQRKVFNRDGLLAHPYMYVGGGDRSQSNGCVVFKNYGRFLRAFKAGEIAKLVVVPNMAELPTYMAGL